MKTVICVILLVMLAMINSQVVASDWRVSKDSEARYNYAELRSLNNKDDLLIRFDKEESCSSELTLAGKPSDEVKQDAKKYVDYPLQFRVDKQTTHKVAKPLVLSSKKLQFIIITMEINKTAIKELMVGDYLRIKWEGSIYKYNLKGSKAAIGEALMVCVETLETYKNRDSKYFSEPSKPKVKMYNQDEDFF